jgi:tRNA (guanine37-N1)-methyltransferase
MVFDIITIFPKIFDSYFKESIIKRAQNKGLIKINIHNLRDFTKDKHKSACLPKPWRRQVDDKPYGGGPGMVMMVEPIYKAIKKIKGKAKGIKGRQSVILFSAKGKKFDQKMAKRFSKYNQLILICGHYEGVDERVAKYIADEEVSIGDYVLTGGEIPAMIVVDAVSRLISGVLGRKESLEEIKGSYPVYTRPEKFLKWSVPKVFLSGHHKKIKQARSLKNRN